MDISNYIDKIKFSKIVYEKYGDKYSYGGALSSADGTKIKTNIYESGSLVGYVKVEFYVSQVDSENITISILTVSQTVSGYKFTEQDFWPIIKKTTVKIEKPKDEKIKQIVEETVNNSNNEQKNDESTDKKKTETLKVTVNKETAAANLLNVAGMSKDASQKAVKIATMLSDQSSITAPNGSKYSKNDIKYLTNQGMSEAQAIATLSQLDKYKKPGENNIVKNVAIQAGVPEDIADMLVQSKDKNGKIDHKTMLKNSANNYINSILDEQLRKKLEEAGITDYTSMTKEQQEKAKQIIIAHYDGKIIMDNYLKKLNDQIYNKLDSIIENNVTGIMNNRIDSLYNKLDSVTNEIENFNKKFGLSLEQEASPTDIKNALALNIDRMLNNGLGNTMNKIQNFEQQAALFGVETNLSSVLASNVNNARDAAVTGIAKNVTPAIQNITKQTKQVSKVISDTKAKIDAQKKKVTEQLDTLKKQAEDKIKEQEQKLISSAMSMLISNVSIKLNF